MGQTSTRKGSPVLLRMVPNTSHRKVMKPSQRSTSCCCSSSRTVKSFCGGTRDCVSLAGHGEGPAHHPLSCSACWLKSGPGATGKPVFSRGTGTSDLWLEQMTGLTVGSRTNLTFGHGTWSSVSPDWGPALLH